MQDLEKTLKGIEISKIDKTCGGPLEEGETVIGELTVRQKKLFELSRVHCEKANEFYREIGAFSEAHAQKHRSGEETDCDAYKTEVREKLAEHKKLLGVAEQYKDLFWSTTRIEHECFSEPRLTVRENFQLVSSPTEKKEEGVRMPDFGGSGLMTALMASVMLDLFAGD